ncbi:hypothetical protein LXG23DRAFT_37539 [Yarrowia lipolytica]|nr:hypothetical protein BKA91DRAFT_129004 [Yarrowia lipolytica]KAE8171715.1 hypothetical protein BKA90DRAFT_129392 [Yarrowia lipolytica]KAJ8053377.1 hypothetical protein LXG23DRAFT_37539 [Yarrowia lipolytica]RMI95333.1 hypothetical protein BD777DRAFT_154837 [Yarrowia lipolytica]
MTRTACLTSSAHTSTYQKRWCLELGEGVRAERSKSETRTSSLEDMAESGQSAKDSPLFVQHDCRVDTAWFLRPQLFPQCFSTGYKVCTYRTQLQSYSVYRPGDSSISLLSIQLWVGAEWRTAWSPLHGTFVASTDTETQVERYQRHRRFRVLAASIPALTGVSELLVASPWRPSLTIAQSPNLCHAKNEGGDEQTEDPVENRVRR